MPRAYEPYVPQNVSDMMDLLGWMMLKSPKFEDDSGYFPGRNIQTTYFALNEGLKAIRKKVGEDCYLALAALSDRMRTHFEADPEDKTEDGIAGRELIVEMEDLIKQSAARKKR